MGIAERIIDGLKAEGIDAESVEIVKNGVPCKGIRIINSDSTVCPIVYYSEQETVETFLMRVRSIVEKGMPQNSVKLLANSEYVKEHSYLAVQRKSTENIVKKEYLNLELIMRVMLDLGDQTGAGSVKITSPLIEQLGVSENELWGCASENTYKEATIRSMAEILGLPTMDEDDRSLFVASSGQMTGGASALYFPKIFNQFCEEHGERECYMLPSSTEEVIVLRGSELFGDGLSMEELVHIVQTINRDQVDPILQLEPAVYRYSTDSDTVEIVAAL